MALKINIPQPTLLRPKISVFGVGGAGGNALNNMIKSNLEGVEFIAANTDAQALSHSLAANRIQLGINTTKGLGAGSFPDRGRAAAEENIDDIIRYLEGNNMIFIAAGMGGGTGTGAAPVIGKLAREREILAVGVVTKPFHFEGKYRMEAALAGIEELKKNVDTLIVIPNQNLFRIANEHTTFESAFKMADDVLHAGVRGVTDLITMPGLVNLDFADIRTIMTKMGKALMGTGEAEGENRAVTACQQAISNPLLDDVSIKGAKGVLVNMTGGPDMTLFEADLAVNTIKKEVDPSANIIFGSAFNEDMKGKIRISVVATGIDEEQDRFTENRDLAKSRVSVVSEIKDADRDEVVVRATLAQGKKTFFDPGLPQEPESLKESVEARFKGRHLPERGEENFNFDDISLSKHPESKINEEVVDEKQAILSKINFINNSFEEDESRFDRVIEKISEMENVDKKTAKNKHEDKKESGGFSLFGFMNTKKKSTKSSSSEDDDPDQDDDQPISSHKSVAGKNRSHNKSNQDQKAKKEKEHLDDHKQEHVSKKHAYAHKKVNQTPEQQDFIIEDDVLNVPAFFRRKK